MPTLDEMLAWGRGERVAGLPDNALPGERTTTEAETLDERRRRARERMLEEKRKKDAARGIAPDPEAAVKGFVPVTVPGERITLLLDPEKPGEGDARLHFGKHDGMLLSKVPVDYLTWCLREMKVGGKVVAEGGTPRPILLMMCRHFKLGTPIKLPETMMPRAWIRAEAEETARVAPLPPAGVVEVAPVVAVSSPAREKFKKSYREALRASTEFRTGQFRCSAGDADRLADRASMLNDALVKLAGLSISIEFDSGECTLVVNGPSALLSAGRDDL